MLKESLLAAALAMPAWHGDKESDHDRHARLAVIAQAIDEAVGIATCRAPAKLTIVEQLPVAKSSETKAPEAQPEGVNQPAPPGMLVGVDHQTAISETGVVEAKRIEAPIADQNGKSASSDSAAPTTDTAPPQKAARCKRVWVGTQRELGFLLLAQAFFETRLALHVHEGNCRKEIGECDSGRAVSLWQLHAGYHLPVERWRELSGTDLDSTRSAALEAARALGRSRNFCGTTEGAVANYATGRGCVWKPAEERVRMAQELTNKFYKKRPPTPPVEEVKTPPSSAVSVAVPPSRGAEVASVASVGNQPTPGS